VGFCANGTLYEPYARALASALAQATDGAACEVHVCGHSGGTAREMVENLDSSAVLDVGGILGKGLRRCLVEASPDVVVIMAGAAAVAAVAPTVALGDEVAVEKHKG